MRKPLACFLVVSVLSLDSQAQLIEYQFQGTITQNVNALGSWASVSPGDPFTVTVEFDSQVGGPSIGFYDALFTLATHSSLEINGMSYDPESSTDLGIRDDANDGVNCIDQFRLTSRPNAEHHLIKTTTVSLEKTSTLPACPVALGSLDMPVALNLADFDLASARFDFETDFTTLQLRYITGDIQSVTVSSRHNDHCAEAFEIPTNLNELPLVQNTGYFIQNFHAIGATTDGASSGGFCDYGISGDEQSYNDVWFTHTSAVDQCIAFTVLADYDTRLTGYEGWTCPDSPPSILACSDDRSPIPSPDGTASIRLRMEAGQIYTLRVGTSDPLIAAGVGALLIEPLGNFIGGYSGDGLQPGDPGCGGFGSLCSGNGGDQNGCTECPCSNNANLGTIGGCVNSQGVSARLIGFGDASVSLPPGLDTDLTFTLQQAPRGALCVLTSGSAVAPQGMSNPCFGMSSGVQSQAYDGLRCAVGDTRRHGGRSTDVNGSVGELNLPWGGPGAPPAGLAQAFGGFSSGETRYFQAIYREDVRFGCQRGLNTTQALRVTFKP